MAADRTNISVPSLIHYTCLQTLKMGFNDVAQDISISCKGKVYIIVGQSLYKEQVIIHSQIIPISGHQRK